MASFLYRFACRAFQKAFFVGVHFMPWREPQLIHGAGSLKELPKHLKANDIVSKTSRSTWMKQESITLFTTRPSPTRP